MKYMKQVAMCLILLIFGSQAFSQKNSEPEIIESPDRGQLTIWKDKMATQFTPTQKNIQNYLKDYIRARTNAFLVYGSF